MSPQIIFSVKPTMQKAGIRSILLNRLDFIIDFTQVKANGKTRDYQEFIEFKPTCSFQENRDDIVGCLNRLFKAKMLSNGFTRKDLSELKIEITSIFTENSEALSQIMKDNPYEPEEEKPKEIFTYKYADSGILYETIILEGKSYFLCYKPDASEPNEQLKLTQWITEEDRIIRPMPRYMHISKPYEFNSEEELNTFFQHAKNETLDSLLAKAKEFVKLYVIQPETTQNLLAISIIWTHFQDIFSTTYYVNATGDNNSGKSAAGHLVAAIAYRAVKLLDPSAAHVFRTLGDFESGQAGALVLDEAEKINDYPDMMSTLKAGYLNGETIPRTNTAGNYEIQRFYPYGWKIIISEKGLSDYKAKGVVDRAFAFSSIPGDPEDDIDVTEVLESHTKAMPERIQRKLKEILQFRKLMLMYRLLHYDTKVADITVGVKRRNRQLVKPVLQLFYKTQSQQEIEQTFEYFLKTKGERKLNTLEAILAPLVLGWFGNEPKERITKPFKTIWFESLKELGCEIADERMAPDMYDSDLGEIYKKTITTVLKDRFGARSDRTETARSLIFDYNIVKKVADNYETNLAIECKERIEASFQEDMR
jgi:hypothetical protein